MHGALGVILINDVAAHPGEADDLEPFGATEGPSDAGIPFVQIKADDRRRLVQGRGKNLEEIEARHRQGSEAALVRASRQPSRSANRSTSSG